ncbi:MAG: glycoside hydrolase family 13 protein [bacterium]
MSTPWPKLKLAEFLSAMHSDESPQYRIPAEPEPGQQVTLRLRTARCKNCAAFLLLHGSSAAIPMRPIRESEWFTWFEAAVLCMDAPVSYSFLVEWEGRRFLVQKKGARPYAGGAINPHYDFRICPGFHTPQWAQGAVQYQIFVDRFCNGDRTNDVADREYDYVGGFSRHIAEWDTPPTEGDFRNFYGGDLEGVMEKLDYLQSLGVEVIYFNPLFVSPSSHKYDTQDYEHIDPHFGVIEEDLHYALHENDHNNRHAEQYIRRVTSAVNLERSDALFAELCQEIHRRGMRIILDGVFNHCGSFNAWMDREGIYARTGEYPPGAFQSRESPYRSYFSFSDGGTERYEGWWNYETLPKLNYESSPRLLGAILDLACKWASPPYSIDGWRLDVAADLGHSREYNHDFWREFRHRLKKANPDLLILAEHYGDPGDWLEGDQWDSVMNYDAFMEPVTFFLTGMEKHSDSVRDDLFLNGEMFFEIMQENMARFHWTSLQCAMNELSNHDHSRFLTRTNRMVGRLNTLGSAAASKGIDKSVFRQAVVIQMTWPGAPTIYYGDEAGQVGWTDPDCRRTYPWEHEDKDLVQLHRNLIRLRTEHPVLRTGSLKPLGAGMGWIAYGRFDEKEQVAVAVNRADASITVTLRFRDLGIEEGRTILCRFLTTERGFREKSDAEGIVHEGCLTLRLPPKSAKVFIPE